jgi:uncharacterized protein YceH (UPF0502 family)
MGMTGEHGPTIIAVVLSVLLSGLVTYVTTRLSAGRTASVRAADQEIMTRAQLVEQMQRRITELEQRLDAALQRERELAERYRSDSDAQESRYRHLTSGLVMYSHILKEIMRKNNLEVPPFEGWERFYKEGGGVVPEWIQGQSC